MIILYITENLYTDDKFKKYSSKVLDFYIGNIPHKKIGVLDIETTGLSPQTCNFVLGGLLIYQEDGVLVKQYFAENINEEAATLKAFLDDVAQLDLVITYNGKHFDINFLKTRMAELGILRDYQFPFNLDIYLVLNGHSSLRKVLPNLKQKTVENYMGLWASRTDEISGAESVELYFEFVRTQSSDLRHIIMLHNSDDIEQLSQLLPVFEKTDIHKAFFTLGFPVDDLYISKISMDTKELKVWGHQRYPISYSAYGLDDSPCFMEFDRFSEEFYISIPIIKKSGLIIIDTKAFEKDFTALEKYETFQHGFLVLKQGNDVNYMEANHFVKLLLERVLEVLPYENDFKIK